RVTAPAVDLGPAGHARLDAVTGHVVGDRLAELLDEHGSLRPRAHQAHVALEYIDKLRQLVQAGRAQERPQARAARVVFLRPDSAGLLLGIDAHAAELEHLELAAVQATPLLTVEHGPRAGELDQRRDQQQQR